MRFYLCKEVLIYLTAIFLCCIAFEYGMTTEEPTTLSPIERKTCGNTTKYYCHNGCCLDENKDEKCCYLFQTSEWCPLLNQSDVRCYWGCCYHAEDEICCSFFTMKYSFILIIAAILVSFLITVLILTCISKCLHCSCSEPSYSRTF